MKKIILIILLSSITQLLAQGFCALRNPNAKIKLLYPRSTGYKTIVGTISESSRKAVKSIASFDIHYSELGRHNLYIVRSAKKTPGLIHSRSEQSEWGLIEIIWSLNLDLTIKDFTFQRCRTSLKKELLSVKFKRQLQGLSYIELIKFLDDKELMRKKINYSPGSEKLVRTLLKSAVKTIILTDICWRENLHLEINKELRPVLNKITINTHSLTKLKFKYINSECYFFAQLKNTDAKIKGKITDGVLKSLHLPVNKEMLTIDRNKIIKEVLKEVSK